MQFAAPARRGCKVTEPAVEPHPQSWRYFIFRASIHRTLSRTPVPTALLRLVDMRVSPPPRSCRTMASLLGTTSSARSKSRSSRPRPRPRPRPRRPRPSRRTRPRPRRPRPWRHRRRGNALSASAPSPSSASPLRADSRRLRCPLTLCTLPLFGTRLGTLPRILPAHCVPPCAPDHACSAGRATCVPATWKQARSTRSRPTQARTSRLRPKLARLKAAPFRCSGCQSSWLPAWIRSGCRRRRCRHPHATLKSTPTHAPALPRWFRLPRHLPLSGSLHSAAPSLPERGPIRPSALTWMRAARRTVLSRRWERTTRRLRSSQPSQTVGTHAECCALVSDGHSRRRPRPVGQNHGACSPSLFATLNPSKL